MADKINVDELVSNSQNTERIRTIKSVSASTQNLNAARDSVNNDLNQNENYGDYTEIADQLADETRSASFKNKKQSLDEISQSKLEI